MPSKSPSTFAHQSTLPRLPIPSLQDTLSKYLKTLSPLLSPKELSHSTTLIQEFGSPNGLGQVLQTRLLAHDKLQKNSWIEIWWERLAYHSWREPLLIHSNWFILFKDSELGPDLTVESGKGPYAKGNFTPIQFQRAAGLISNYLNYKDMIDK